MGKVSGIATARILGIHSDLRPPRHSGKTASRERIAPTSRLIRTGCSFRAQREYSLRLPWRMQVHPGLPAGKSASKASSACRSALSIKRSDKASSTSGTSQSKIERYFSINALRSEASCARCASISSCSIFGFQCFSRWWCHPVVDAECLNNTLAEPSPGPVCSAAHATVSAFECTARNSTRSPVCARGHERSNQHHPEPDGRA
jgi:hypothetical protein